MIEKNFDIPFISDLALHEKQIQQNYRPIIAVHKWFARRPGTLFRGLLLSEFANGNLKVNFYKAHNLNKLKIADPFMGGGSPLIEANRLGCDITGYDINPMAYWIVRQEISHLDLEAYRKAAVVLQARLEKEVGTFYRTICTECGSPNAHVKYFIWVKTLKCDECGMNYDLFPGYLLAGNQRHTKNVIICSACGELNEVEDRKKLSYCHDCGVVLKISGPATRNHCKCPHCGKINTYPKPSGAPQHRMTAIEYHCPSCKPNHQGRFFKKPDREDLEKYEIASESWRRLLPSFAPDDEIPPGDETDRLHRWGYRQYREMFNDRQLLGLELSCRAIAGFKDENIRNALATNLSDLLRYQNMLCRYDTMALKSLDIFSIHGFPVGLMQCESNLLGISNGGKGSNIGSGGWSNIILKYERAKAYCDNPFEIRHQGGKKVQVAIKGEWIGEHRNTFVPPKDRNVALHCCSSTFADLPPGSLDAVITDPPYFANVQYAELMDFCYVWLRRLAIDASGVFDKQSTRDENELTGNITMERGLSHFTEGLAAVFVKMACALKEGAPLAFTYHHNKIEAYLPVAVAVLDAGLTCSASIPSPAEMGASIHINRTGSSIIDTVFICRSTGSVPRRTIVSKPEEIAGLVKEDLDSIRKGNVNLTHGDIRCIAYGHLVRLAIWSLRKNWNVGMLTSEKMKMVARAVDKLGGWPIVERLLSDVLFNIPRYQSSIAREEQEHYGGKEDEISF